MAKRLLLLATLVFSSAGLAEEVSAVVSGWDRNHPEAATALADVVRQTPEGARRMFLWDRDHPLRAQSFVRWINEHPDQGLDAFVASHRYWPVVDLVMKPYHATFEAFISWARAHPDATRDLAAEPKGLAWVGFHLFADLLPAAPATAVPQGEPPTDAPEGLPAAPPAPPQER